MNRQIGWSVEENLLYDILKDLERLIGVTSISGGGGGGSISLTTTGTSGAATLIGNVLNIPIYSSGGGGTPGGANTQVQFNNSGAFGGSANLTFASNTLTLAGKEVITGGTLGDQAQALNITATQPSSPTGSQIAVVVDVTSAGSASQSNIGFYSRYNAGYTGSSSTYAGGFNNLALGTGNTLIPASGSNVAVGNFGANAGSTGTVAGLNAGFFGFANGGDVSAGLVGIAQFPKNSATNIGVVGSAINTGTSPVHVGGWFSLNRTTNPTQSAALIADNGAQTDPIVRFKDNGTDVFAINDGGAFAFSGGAGTSGNALISAGSGAAPAWGAYSATNLSGLGTGVATWLATPSWTNFSSAITGTAPFWLTSGTTTLVSASTITSSTINGLTFTGSSTSTASSDAATKFTYSVTGSSTGTNDAVAIHETPTVVAGGNNQKLVGRHVKLTATPGAFTGTSPMSLWIEGPSTGTGNALYLTSGSTNSNSNAIYLENSGTSLLFRVRSDGPLFFGSSAFLGQYDTTYATASPTANQYLLQHNLTPDSGGTAWRIKNNASITSTSGDRKLFALEGNTFAPTSGTATMELLDFKWTLNQTSTSSGAVKLIDFTNITYTSVLGTLTAIDYNPTVTSVTGTHYGLLIRPAGAMSGFGTGTPTAKIHIAAGTATANTAPLKLTSGTNLTTPEAGAVEFDGTNYFVTSSTTRYTLAKTLTATATLDFPSTGASSSNDLTITVTGAADGDSVIVTPPNGSTFANSIYTAWVSAANTVTVRFSNLDLVTSRDPSSGTFRAVVFKY